MNFPSYTTVYNPKELIINNDSGYMAASLMHFTLNDPQFPSKPVYGYARYTISRDGSVTLAFQTLDAINYSPLTDIYSYSCKLGESAKIYI